MLNYIYKTGIFPYEKKFSWEYKPFNERLYQGITEILLNMIRCNHLDVVKILIENLDHPLPRHRGINSILNRALGCQWPYYEEAKKEIFEYLLEGKYFFPDIDTLYYILINDNFSEYLDKLINDFSDQDIWEVISRFIRSPDGEFFTNWNEEKDCMNIRLNNLAKLFSRIDLLALNADDKVWTVLRPPLLEVSPLVQILLNNFQFQFILNSRSIKELIALIQDNSDSFDGDDEYRIKYINLHQQLRQFIIKSWRQIKV